jgi:large subunit ribosomal protein L37e
MTKGTPAMGRRSGKKNMIHCRRCGRRTYHLRKKKCAACGYGKSARMRKYKFYKKDYRK